MRKKNPPDFNPPDESEGPESPTGDSWPSGEMIDLGNLFTKELTASGSFDIRSGIWATTLGKLLQALPIPALLVDESWDIVVANQACARISKDYENIQGRSFASFLRDPTTSGKPQPLLTEIFSTRRPQVAEVLLEIDNHQIWGRVTSRSIRIADQRFVLVLLEDLSRQKKQLLHSRKKEEQLRLYRDELENRVEERTAKLKALNEMLELEIKGRRRVEEALRTLIHGIEGRIKEHNESTLGNLSLVIKPLIEQLKTEKLPERARLLLQSMEGHLSEALSSFEYDVSVLSPELTPQELRICELMRSGLTTKQIAEVLEVTPHTVFSYRTSIRKKLRLAGGDEDLALYLRKKL